MIKKTLCFGLAAAAGLLFTNGTAQVTSRRGKMPRRDRAPGG